MTDNILFSADPAADLSKFLGEKRYSTVAVLVDDHTDHYCYPLLHAAMPAHDKIVVASGEEHKNLATCEQIWTRMTSMQMDRHGVLIVIGGGVLGDMGGFCAATYKRGIDFILIPTTLLAQVDASIGGKLGIDFQHFKNHLGVFQTPALTLLHAGFLKTLPADEKRSGFAEVIKHTLIADKAMWEKISARPLDDQPWNELLQHSVKVKLAIVSEDRFESGRRKTLNAGHTIGHAVETYLLQHNRKILHGEAVAAGLVCEAFLARQRKMLRDVEFGAIRDYIISTFGKVDIDAEDVEAIAEVTTQDKKNKAKRILCVLLEEIGDAKWDCEITTDEVKTALTFYRST